ncbi:MAG: hypothetical protein KA144_13715 [Xanthomonadaceae bacterium]|nr:hypothetical protein [Xanthomonadaceae bacterium]
MKIGSFRTFFAIVALTIASAAAAKQPSERQQILDAARPRATTAAGQPVRIKVDKLNVDGGWAVLVGEVVGPPDKAIDWDKAPTCEAELDKMLWVVLRKRGAAWRVEHIDICASEPPYWYLEQFGGFVWPCGVYKGLDAPDGENLEAQCRLERKTR